jgi:hypothetical protein
MITVTITDTREEKGVEAAAAAYNATLPEGETPLTPEEYLQARVDQMAQGWANTNSIGVITSGAYVLRFTAAENDAINTAAETDPTLAGFLTQVRNAPQVELYADEVIQGHAYLVAQELLTQERSDEILAY